MAGPVLELDCLRVDYDTVCAVHDLSLQLLPGDVYGLVGPNGAGKTTTLRATAGLLEPTYGRVRIRGFDLHRQPHEAKRLIGFTPDHSPAYNDLTVWEYLDLYASAYELPRERRGPRISECIAMAWLQEKHDALVGGLSRGMKQRLMLARTLLHDPPVMLLDEPASGLDPLGRRELRDLLVRLREAGKAILISSHILSEMSAFCTKMGVMERGRLVKQGTVADLAGLLPKAQKVFVRTAKPGWGETPSSLPVVGGVPRAEARQSLAPPSEDGTRLEDLLRAESHVIGIEPRDGAVVFDWTGSDAEAAELLRRLVNAGVAIIEFRPHAVDMEEIFLRTGVKELS
ncbi:MAG: ABC transporter ATP-binding protein [Verrucomicrobia bacterium]|nr:ABC transporter ATP-binding protein [Verrucomicrobiota bacterium]